MKILLIRHGETTDNVKKVYAGVTDSSLTSHGVLQAERLASHIDSNFPRITHLFASPLQRAKKTAEIIRNGQTIKPSEEAGQETTTATAATAATTPIRVEVKIVKDLEEQDFGSYEGEQFLNTVPLRERRRFKDSPKTSTTTTPVAGHKRKKTFEDAEEAADVVMTAGEDGPLSGKGDALTTRSDKKGDDKGKEKATEEEFEEFREMETAQAITARAERFVREHIIPLLPAKPNTPRSSPHGSSTAQTSSEINGAEQQSSEAKPKNQTVVIVSHGMFLVVLWKVFVALFPPTAVLATTPVVEKGWYQGKIPGWGNTGYMHISIFASSGGPVVSGNMTVIIEGVNEKEHLKGLQRTGGGVGSQKYDEKQMKMDRFLNKSDTGGERSKTRDGEYQSGAVGIEKEGLEAKKARVG